MMKICQGKIADLFRFTATARMALGMAMLVVTMLLILLVFGLVPDHREAALRGRCALSELVALQIRPVILDKDLQRIEGLLEAMVARNDEIQGGGVRRANGTLVATVGDHVQLWNDEILSSDDRYVLVPLNAGGRQWGRVEICFAPLVRRGLIGLIDHPWVRLVGLMAIACGAVFYLYLRVMLRHLDPSGAVPKRVRSALDTLGDGLLILNREYKIVLVNQSLAESIGESADKLVGLDASSLPWGDDADQDNGYPWVRAMEAACTIQGETIRFERAANGAAVFLISCSVVPGSDGSPQGVLVSLDDVTELEATKQQLSRAKDAAETANQAKSAFLANMSHEIRTPMNAILGFTEVLRRGIERDETKRLKHLNTIHSSGTHLLTLINDILDLSKVESGRLEVESIPCAMHQIVAEVVTIMRVRAEQKGITLDYQFDGKIPASIHSDPARLRQILTNLTGNAVKFTEQGGVRLVTALDDSQDRPQLVVQVIDTGIGMSESAVAKIFDPFSQADASVSRRFGGTGLGLSISKRFAAAMGGELTVKSQEGVGSVFELRIEAGCVDDAEMIEPTEADLDLLVEPEVSPVARLPELRVLLVDDAEENRDLMRVILQEAGAICTTAENGLEAVAHASKADFDVILMDMNMPVMDGYTATRKLRQQGCDTPIIALTAHAMESAAAECRNAGCTGFLSKPIDFNLLMATLVEIAGIDADSLPVPDANAAATEAVDPASTGPIYSTLNTANPKFHAIVVKFIKRLPEQLEAMSSALANGDFDELADLAHWLKGSGPNVGFAEFGEIAKRLEDSSHQAEPEEARLCFLEITLLSARIAVDGDVSNQRQQPVVEQRNPLHQGIQLPVGDTMGA
jgi:PAS domain S-box-containing protein